MTNKEFSRGVSRRTLLGAAGAAAVGTGLGSVLGGGAAQAAVRLGIDYSWGRPRPSKIVEAGYSFVCRYVSHSTSGKNLTRAEADALRAVGLDIVTNWEYTANEALNGYAAGAANAEEAHRQAIACGMPADRPIYFSVDFDATSGHQAAINSYFDGIASKIGRARTGAYGGYGVIDRLFDAGKIRWGWQTYAWSGGNWDSRAGLRQVQNGITVDGADCDRNEAHAADFGQWGGGPTGKASIYGIMPSGHLTYTVIDVPSGARKGAVSSRSPLPFTPVAMATLDFNTLLVTSTAADLYRVDIGSNQTEVTFTTTKIADRGWTHDRLAYDGSGHLFGIADGVLKRYDVPAGKPGIGSISGTVTIGSGFALNTLTVTGPDRLLGTTSAGELLWYRVNGPGDWRRYELRSSTWGGFANLVSPGGGVYFGHKADGSVNWYLDGTVGDGDGSDIRGLGVIDASGWSQRLLSAQPGTVS